MKPDWSGGVTETLSWRTRVSRTRGETRPGIVLDHRPVVETRECLASAPLRTWTSSHWIGASTDLELAGAHPVEAIVGYPPSVVAARLNATDDALLIDSAWARGYEVGHYVLVERADGTRDTRQIVDIDEAFGTVSDEWVFLDSALARSPDDVIMAAFRARSAPTWGVQWHTPTTRVLGQTWTAVEPQLLTSNRRHAYPGVSWTPVAGGETYEVIPWRGVDAHTQAVSEIRAQGVGGAWTARQPVMGTVDRIERTRQILGAHERAELRTMLYRRLGRLEPAFVPAGVSLPFVGLRSYDGGVYAAFDAAWWASAPWRPETRAAVVLWCKDGSAVYASAQIWADDTHPVLPVPADEVWIAGRLDPVPTSEVESVDWLLWARLEADSVAIHYASPEVASVTLGWVTLPSVPYIGVPGPPPPAAERYASVQISIAVSATGGALVEDYLDGSMLAQAAMVIGRLRLDMTPPVDYLDGAMLAQAAMVVGRMRLDVPPIEADPVAAILATEPAHFWWFGGLTYGGVETMRDDQGDPIVDGSTDVYAVRDLVTDSWDMDDWSDSGGIRFADHRLTGGVEGLAIEGLSIADASWVTVIRRTTSSPLNTNLLLEAEQATGDVYSADVVGTVIQGVDGSSSSRTGATFGAETAYYRYRSGSDRKALAMDGDDSEWAVSGTGAAAWGGVYLRGDNGLLADALCIIVYDHGERVKELLDEGLHQLIIDLQEYEP